MPEKINLLWLHESSCVFVISQDVVSNTKAETSLIDLVQLAYFGWIFPCCNSLSAEKKNVKDLFISKRTTARARQKTTNASNIALC